MTTNTKSPQVGDRIWFDDKSTIWLARAESEEGRYLIATSSMFGHVVYTIVDERAGIRGPIDQLFPSFKITSTAGSDQGIDKLLTLLRDCPPDADCGHQPGEHRFGISHRNRVPLNVTRVERKG